jgi:ABC-type sugar transport system permease subunit
MKVRSKTNLLYLLLMLPVLILIGSVTFYPAIYNIIISFRDDNMRNLSAASFVGLNNYIRLFHDPFAWQALGRTFIYMFFSVTSRLVVGMIFALLLRMPSRLRVVTRTSIILPWAMSEVMVSAMWIWILNHRTGLLNGLLNIFNVPPLGWLVYPSLAMFSVVLVSLWKNLAFTYLLLFAALQQIPAELYEAAKIDGCNAWRSFINVTLSLIRPTLLVVVVMVSINSFSQFSIVYSLTGGGPLRTTELIGLYMYQQAFTFLDLSYGATIGVMMFILNMGLTVLYNFLLKSESLY